MATTYSNMGIKSWNLSSDFFSYTDLDANWLKIDAHDHTSGKGVQIPTAGIADSAITANKIAAAVIDNSKIAAAAGIVGTKLAANTVTNDKIATADLQKLGLSDSVIRRGKSVITGVGTRNNALPGALSNGPDQVTNIVLPTDGLIFVGFQALWQIAAATSASAQLFINNGGGDVPIKVGQNGGAPSASTAIISAAPYATDVPLFSNPAAGNLATVVSSSASTEVTTGQAIGGNFNSAGIIPVFAAAGTYTISAQFWTNGTTVSVKNRRLWVWTMGF